MSLRIGTGTTRAHGGLAAHCPCPALRPLLAAAAPPAAVIMSSGALGAARARVAVWQRRPYPVVRVRCVCGMGKGTGV